MGLWLAGLAVVVVATALVGRGTGAAATDSPVGAHLPAATAVSLCRTQATALIADDLARVVTGMPDAGVLTQADQKGSATSEARQVHDVLVGQATSDVLNTYHRDAGALLAAYQRRIAAACVTAGAR